MINIEYEIKLNDEDKPYISLPEDYDHKPVDRFFALEMAAYILIDTLKRNRNRLDQTTVNEIQTSINTLLMLGEEVGVLIKGQMETSGSIEGVFNKYSFSVNTMEELLSLNYNGIIRDDKIFKREPGLKVKVIEESKIFELVDGIDNENWREI